MRQTDRPRYWIGNNRPHIRTAMWRKNGSTFGKVTGKKADAAKLSDERILKTDRYLESYLNSKGPVNLQ